MPVFFGIEDKFYETLTLEKAKILFRILSSFENSPINIHTFMFRSDHYVKRYNELLALFDNKKSENK